MLNNKTNSTTAHIKTKAFTDPDLFSKLKKNLPFGPPTPPNTPNSSYGVIGSTAKFYISSSSSSSSKSASNEDIHVTTHRRHTF